MTPQTPEEKLIEEFENTLLNKLAYIGSAGERHKEKLKHVLLTAFARIREDEREKLKSKIGFLRQWLNEDRIDNPKKMVTNEEIEKLLSTLTPRT